MKTKISFLSILLCVNTVVFGQLKISSSGQINMTGNVPITLKVNNISAGFTGNSAGNVSFGYESQSNPTAGYDNTAIGYTKSKRICRCKKIYVGKRNGKQLAETYNQWWHSLFLP